MKIFVAVKPHEKTDSVIELDSTHFRVSLRAPAREGAANKQLVEVIARHYRIPMSSVRIVAGFRSRKKILEIL